MQVREGMRRPSMMDSLKGASVAPDTLATTAE
jgi:hypothetical protein